MAKKTQNRVNILDKNKSTMNKVDIINQFKKVCSDIVDTHDNIMPTPDYVESEYTSEDIDNMLKALKDKSGKDVLDYAIELGNLQYTPDYVEQDTETEEVLEPTVSKKEYDELYNKYLLKVAELDNYIKRTNAERIKQLQLQDKHLLEAIIPALNSIYAAVKISPDDGPGLLYKILTDALAKVNITIVAPMVGDAFDGDIMHAISAVPAPDTSADNTVVDVLSPGYKIHDTYIDYPKVVVYQA